MGKNNKILDLQDIVGTKIRKFTVLGFSHVEQVQQSDRLRNKYFYKCLCECGKETLVSRFHLKQEGSPSATQSCGCYQKAQSLKGHEKQKGKPRPHVQKPNGESILNTQIALYKKGALKRNLSYLLSDEEFEKITGKNCFYCGSSPRLLKKKDCFTTRSMNGIDRIDSNRGYEVDNCVACCKQCNYMKLDYSKDEFLTQVRKIANNHPLKIKSIYLVTGAPASGKSWILKNLQGYECIDSDLISKSKLVEEIAKCTKTPVVALTIGVSTFIKNNPQFEVKLLVIQEDLKTIKERMTQRGGKITPTLERRIKRMERLAKKASFSGTSSEVLTFLRDICADPS